MLNHSEINISSPSLTIVGNVCLSVCNTLLYNISMKGYFNVFLVKHSISPGFSTSHNSSECVRFVVGVSGDSSPTHKLAALNLRRIRLTLIQNTRYFEMRVTSVSNRGFLSRRGVITIKNSLWLRPRNLIQA